MGLFSRDRTTSNTTNLQEVDNISQQVQGETNAPVVTGDSNVINITDSNAFATVDRAIGGALGALDDSLDANAEVLQTALDFGGDTVGVAERLGEQGLDFGESVVERGLDFADGLVFDTLDVGQGLTESGLQFATTANQNILEFAGDVLQRDQELLQEFGDQSQDTIERVVTDLSDITAANSTTNDARVQKLGVAALVAVAAIVVLPQLLKG